MQNRYNSIHKQWRGCRRDHSHSIKVMPPFLSWYRSVSGSSLYVPLCGMDMPLLSLYTFSFPKRNGKAPVKWKDIPTPPATAPSSKTMKLYRGPENQLAELAGDFFLGLQSRSRDEKSAIKLVKTLISHSSASSKHPFTCCVTPWPLYINRNANLDGYLE
jgi:hypothetical protein